MRRLLLIPILAILAVPIWAQDGEEPEADAPETPAADSSDAGDDVDDENSVDLDELDELYSEEDEDKFIPSEDVAFGQDLVFPTDI